MERDWLARAARSADRAGRFTDLLGFFDKQRQRSPRDVRWAVAVREISGTDTTWPAPSRWPRPRWRCARSRRTSGARPWTSWCAPTACRRRPTTSKAGTGPRAADESVARWRSGLYARAGQDDKALAVETAALTAFSRAGEMNAERREELRQRTARAARRLHGYGLPRLAWRLLGAPVLAKVSASGYSEREQAELALLTGNFDRLLRHRLDDSDYRSAAAAVLRENGRPETRQDAQALLLMEVFPAAPGARSDLSVIWPLVQEARLERQMRFAIAQRLVAAAARTVAGRAQRELPRRRGAGGGRRHGRRQRRRRLAHRDARPTTRCGYGSWCAGTKALRWSRSCRSAGRA